MWRTEAFGCSANPARTTWTWSAIWHEASCGIGWLIICPVAAPWMAVCVNEPNSIQDNNLIWLMHSTNSLGLQKKVKTPSDYATETTYVCCVEVLHNHGRYFIIALLSLPFPLVISSAKYWATPHLIIPPKVSSFKPTLAPLQ